MDYHQDLLARCFLAQGLDPERVRKAVEAAFPVMIAAGITTAKVIEAVDRDAHIYKLRVMRTVALEPMTAVVIASRVGLCRQEIFKALNRHLRRHRAVLRLMIA